MILKSEYRLVATLSVCQLLLISAGAVILTLSGLIGHHLASDKSLATLPFALMCLVNALLSIPAANLMLRVGRKKGFMLGALFGCLSGVIAAMAVFWQSFALFCLGVALWGGFMAFGQFYRYAAAEGVQTESKSTAISIVVASGIIAVFVGPQILSATQDLFPAAQFSGSFLALTALCILSILVTGFLQSSQPKTPHESRATRPPPIAWNPTIIAGLVNGAVAFAAMVFVMTASPLATVHFGHSVSDAATVIQWHLLGMYGPSLVTGWLISRFGEVRIMFLGIAVLLASLLTALHGISLHHFSLALLFLGIGWNLLYVSSSVLLSTPQEASERARVQAIGEFSNNAALTVAAFSAGSIFVHSGWATLNLIVLPLLLVALLVTIRYALDVRARTVEPTLP